MTSLDFRPTLADLTPEDVAMLLVPAGQPWCENSLDGPARPPEETRAAEVIAPLLTELGFSVALIGRTPTRANLVATLTFGPGPTLLLNDHLDTYPAGPPSRWTMCDDPYVPQREGDRIYARGTSDTRGNLATLLSAAARVALDPPTAGTLTVALTVDEERNGVEGALWLLNQQGLTADAAITVEPTGWQDRTDGGIAIALAHTGHALVDVTVTGRSSHIWRPDTGVNAAHRLLQLIDYWRTSLPGWGVATVGLAAGEPGMAQFTPLTATARLAVVGLGPDVTPAEILQRFYEAATIAHPDADSALSLAFAPGPTFVAGTVAVDPGEAIVRALSDAYETVTGQAVRTYVKPAYCDTIRFRNAGIPAVTFGPGDDGWAVYDESISVARMQTATAVLERCIRGFFDNGQ